MVGFADCVVALGGFGSLCLGVLDLCLLGDLQGLLGCVEGCVSCGAYALPFLVCLTCV